MVNTNKTKIRVVINRNRDRFGSFWIWTYLQTHDE